MAASPTRRQLLALGGLVGGGALLAGTRPARATGTRHGDPWAAADRIVAGTARPRFPARYFDVTRFGAVGDGVFDCTAAFRAAIGACARAGGGHVVVPAGRFLTGPIHLRSRVDLHVSSGATLAFSTDPAAYLPVVLTRFGGIECLSYSPFVYAFGQHDIAVTGEGTLDGQADNQHWWPLAGKTQYGWQPGMPTDAEAGTELVAAAAAGVPVNQRVYGAGYHVRPLFLQPYRCDRVLISGITTTNTPNWQLNPVLCTNVTVENVTATSLGPNNDGCDPESCDHVVIDGVTFNTGDDCIAVKAGKDADGRRLHTPSQHIVIQNCAFLAGHGAVTIGSEMTGGVRDLYVRDCHADSSTLNDLLRLKTNSARGGFIEHVYVRDVTANRLNDAVVTIDFYYGDGPGLGYNPTVRDLHLERVTVASTAYPLYLNGYPDDPISDLTLTDCVIGTAAKPNVAHNVDGLVFTNVSINGTLATPPQPYATLAAAYDSVATGTATTPGDFDGAGRYYTADSLAAAGLTPGAPVTVAGHTFTWPDVTAGTPDNVAAGAQDVLLTGSGTTLGFLGAAAHGNQSGTVTVYYADGTSSTATLALTDWWTNQAQVGDTLVASATTDAAHAAGVYHASVPLSPGKTVHTIELPANANLHLFATAIA